MGIVDGEGDAVGRRGILKKLIVDLSNLLLVDKIEGDLVAGKTQERDHFANCRGDKTLPNGKRFLSVNNFYFQAIEEGVLGRPVTLVFFPSTHLPSLRRTSTRSNRFNTFRFFPPLFDFP